MCFIFVGGGDEDYEYLSLDLGKQNFKGGDGKKLLDFFFFSIWEGSLTLARITRKTRKIWRRL